MENLLNIILNFDNKKVDSSIINQDQITHIVKNLSNVLESKIEGDVVELGCYVGESSKYIRKTLDVYESNKTLTVFDSFEGLPPLSEYEINTGWKPFTLKTTEEVLINNFENNNLTPPKIVKGWFKDIKNEDLPEKISFAFLDGDFYDSIYDSLVKIYDRMVEGGVILFHDFRRFDLPGVDAAICDFFKERNIEYNLEVVCDQLGRHVVGGSVPNETKNDSGVTIVTGLWNINRDGLTDGWSRSFQHYLDKFEQLLKIESNMIIFGEEELQSFVFQRRDRSNTQFIIRSKDWFRTTVPYNKIQEIRTNSNWYNQSGWLSESTQGRLEWYNPLVMSKMFLMNDARIVDQFNSSHLFWLDAGITNTIHPGYFTHDKIQNKLPDVFTKFGFVAFPYNASNEIHGFSYPEINQYAGDDVKLVCRGGLFGGPTHTISEINTIYYNTLFNTINDGYMGTEESIFSIMLYKYPSLIDYVEIHDNGLIGKFCEDLKNNEYEVKNTSGGKSLNDDLNINKTGLYVITFNSPKQFRTLIDSMLAYDKDYLNKTTKFLLDNSSDESTFEEYSKLCEEYNFEHIKKDNLGICGGRQWIAEHFQSETDLDFYWFFEDDMFFYPKQGEVCRNGFNRYVPNLYSKTLQIVKKENFDFLKLNFSEFFGDNGTQWAWYNVPQHVRQKYWPSKNRLPEQGLDPNAPKAVYDSVRTHQGVPYVTGEVYYCNWPQIVSRPGNQKMFLDTTWAHPFEQTWMSHMYQLVKEDKLYPGLLLMTPTEHDRFEHYERNLRKES